jgi:fibronectin type 3 domain-containing protein
MTRALTLVLLIVVTRPLDAQTIRPSLTLVPHGDSVLVYLTEAPPLLGGFVVYRARAGQPAERLTTDPVRSVHEPALAAGILGTDLPAVMRALRATDEGEVLRRLHGDPFAGTLLSLYYRSVATVLGRFYADGGLTRGVAYDYEVVFVDAVGRETGHRVTGSVTVTDAVPAPPTAGKVTAGDHAAAIGWQYPKYRGDPRDFVIGFHVYRADGPAGAMRRLTTAPVLRDDAAPFTYHDRDVRNDVAYRYQVTAVDMLGVESAPGAAASLRATDRTPPAIPVGLAVENGNGVVRLVWRMSPETDAAGYHVERAAGLSQPYTRLTRIPLPVDTPEWVDSAVTGGRQYFYRVIAVDAAGNASEPSNALSSLPLDRTPPLPPPTVTTVLQERRVVVRWTASPSRDVQGYHVYRGDAPDRLVRLTSKPIAAMELVDSGYADAGLAPGRRYLVRVSAVDSSFNESPPAATELTLPDDEPPAPPAAFTVRSVMGRYAEIEWVGSSALDVQAYVLTRADSGAAAIEVGRFDAATKTWRDTAVVTGRVYAYQLVAVDSAGNSSVAVGDTLHYGDFTPPASPRYLAARAGRAGVELVWERVASPDLAGYVVYRSTLPTGVFERVTPQPVTALRFVDPTGRPDHFYVVRAVDRSGNESAASPVARGGAQ